MTAGVLAFSAFMRGEDRLCRHGKYLLLWLTDEGNKKAVKINHFLYGCKMFDLEL